jgi:deoxyribose-phosphate aldolase
MDQQQEGVAVSPEAGGEYVAPAAVSGTEAAMAADMGTRLSAVRPVTRVKMPDHLAAAVHSTDHTALGSVNEQTIINLCTEAASADPYPNSVCVQGEKWATVADKTLRALGCRGEIAVCAVGERHFPKGPLKPIDPASPNGYNVDQLPGNSPLTDKLADAEEAMRVANVFDMVLNSRLILEGRDDEAVAEILAVRAKMDETNPEAPLRVICSTGMLRRLGGEEMVKKVCAVVSRAAQGFPHGRIDMKTCTGFVENPVGGKFGATIEDVRLMREELPKNVRIKAAGGVSEKNAEAVMSAGADFIGASGLLRNLLKPAA